MTDTIYKTFRAEIKEIDKEEGTIDMLIPMSTGEVDRDGEVIEPTAFKKTLSKFMKRPVLLSSHDYRDLTSQIGELLKLKITDEGLLGKPKYYVNEGNQEADWAFNLASKGMAAFSVGFIPKVWEDGDGDKSPRRTFREVELLEISQVVVPSNREAIQGVRAKSLNNPVICELCDDLLVAEEITKPEVTENYIRIPVPGEAGKHEGHRIRTITISEEKGIKALYCGECKKNITYLFDKDKWTVAEAERWVEEHKGLEDMPEINIRFDDGEVEMDEIKEVIPYKEREVSQAEIKDELDYIFTGIKKAGLSEDSMEVAWEVVRQIMRLPGADIPVDILAKIGAVLNAKNKQNLKQAQELIQSVLDSVQSEHESVNALPAKPTKEEITEAVGRSIAMHIDRLKGKVS